MISKNEVFKKMWDLYEEHTRKMNDDDKMKLLENISQEAVRRMVGEDLPEGDSDDEDDE